MHVINIFTNDGKLVQTMGERGVPGRGPNNFNRPDRHRLAARRHVLRRRRLRRHARGQVRSQRQVPDGLGPAAGRSEQAGPERVLVGAQHRHQPRPPALRRRPRASPHAGLRRERQVPRDVADRPRLGGAGPHRHRGRLHLGGRLDDRSAGQVRPERPLHPRHRRARARSPGSSTASTRSASTRSATSTSPRWPTIARRSSARSRTPIPTRSSARWSGGDSSSCQRRDSRSNRW